MVDNTKDETSYKLKETGCEMTNVLPILGSYQAITAQPY
jgi:hypothetical protein